MQLNRETAATIRWLGSVMKVLVDKRPFTTTAVIAASVLSRITRLLAFFLPLKVILLAGSSGVPRYFPFIDPDFKLNWIIGLTAGAFVCYAMTLLLDALTRRWSEAGSAEIMQEANELSVIRNQAEKGQTFFTLLCQTCAGLIFVVLGVAVLAIIDPRLCIFLVSLIATQYLFTAWAMRGSDDGNPVPTRRMVQDNLDNYLTVLVSVSFLLGFLVILAPFLVDGMHGNILLAILCIVVLRQVVSNLSDAVSISASLVRYQHKINALLFREHQLDRRDQDPNQTFRDLFHKAARQGKLQEALANSGRQYDDVDVYWADPVVSGVFLFNVQAENIDGSSRRHYQLHVTTPRMIHQVEYEDFLFDRISRQRLKAPELVTSFTEGTFECRVYEGGTGMTVNDDQWPSIQTDLTEHFWSCQPPKALVSSYMTSHKLLDRRLSKELIARLGVAVDSDKERKILGALQAQHSQIVAWLETLPLYIHNPNINRYNVIQRDGTDVLVMYWGRWALEPIGAFLPRALNIDRLNRMLDTARSARNDFRHPVSAEQLQLVSLCRQLEDEIDRNRYKSALRVADQIVRKSAVPGVVEAISG